MFFAGVFLLGVLLGLSPGPVRAEPNVLVVAQAEEETKTAPRDTEGYVIPPGQHEAGMAAGSDAKGELEPIRNADGSISSPGAGQPVLPLTPRASSTPAATRQKTPTFTPTFTATSTPTSTATLTPTPTPTGLPAAPTFTPTPLAVQAAVTPTPTAKPKRFVAPTIVSAKAGLGSGNPPPTPTPAGLSSAGNLPIGHLWAIILGSYAGALLILYVGIWRMLLPRLRSLERRLDQSLRPLDDGRLRGARQFSRRQAELLLGVTGQEGGPLPYRGLSVALTVSGASGLKIRAELIAQALLAGNERLLVVTRKDPERLAQEVLRAADRGNREETLDLAQRLFVAPGVGQSLQGLSRQVETLLQGRPAVLILDHPRWLDNLDAFTRSAWVLAKVDRRLSELARVTGVPIWLIFEEGPLAPGGSYPKTLPEGMSAWVKVGLNEHGGLNLVGNVLGNEVDAPLEGV